MELKIVWKSLDQLSDENSMIVVDIIVNGKSLMGYSPENPFPYATNDGVAEFIGAIANGIIQSKAGFTTLHKMNYGDSGHCLEFSPYSDSQINLKYMNSQFKSPLEGQTLAIDYQSLKDALIKFIDEIIESIQESRGLGKVGHWMLWLNEEREFSSRIKI